ncbi:glutathione S-transferase [Hyaloraphidium curvatum]|nr:glutathione S-transferase [Hyaloraphidium curvatum]
MASNQWIPPPKIEDLYAATAGGPAARNVSHANYSPVYCPPTWPFPFWSLPLPTAFVAPPDSLAGNNFSAINAPTAGSRVEQELPRGAAPFQLYSLSTPNGQKVGIMLEELGIDYDAHVINIGKGDQFQSGFVSLNPNSKIPTAVDYAPKSGGDPIRLFESGSIVMYLAEKYGKFLPKDEHLRAEIFNFVFWQMGSQGPMSGQFGHFFVYAPPEKHETRAYGSARYGMEVQRLCDMLDKHLSGSLPGSKGPRKYLVGEEYTVADIMVLPWALQIKLGYKHEAAGFGAREFLSFDRYEHLNAWIERIKERPAVKRGLRVCNYSGVPKPWLNEEGKGKI